MLKKSMQTLSRTLSGQSGYILVPVLILLLLGSVMLPPLMDFAASGRKTGQVYEKKTDELYAADAGIEDATWQIKYDRLESVFTEPVFSAYDYSTSWPYNLSRQVNDRDVAITVSNVWVPSDIPTPSEAEASAIIEAGKLMITGSATGTTYKIKMSYTPGAGEDLNVETIGVWLPRGFSYVEQSSSPEADPFAAYYSVPTVESHAGNQAVLWRFISIPFTDLPGVDPQDSPMVAEVTFEFTSVHAGGSPAAVAWMTTSGVADIPFSWDADTRIFRLTSQAGGTTVESYVAKEELRQLRMAIGGDYEAVGDSLMVDTTGDAQGIRDVLLNNSDATVSEIPEDAEVRAAFLYWSGWRSEASKQTVFSDTCSSFTNWNYGSAWSISSGRFRGHYASGDNLTRYITLKNSLNLSSFEPGRVQLSWDQSEGGTLESDDGLDFALSADGGATWSSNIVAFRDDLSSTARYIYLVPAQYLTANCKVRFYLQSLSGDSEYAYLDNIKVTAMTPDTSVVFKIDGQQVYLDDNGDPQQGAQELTATRSQLLQNLDYGTPHGYTFSSYRDVTALVKAFSAEAPGQATNHPGNATYVVGNVTANTGDNWSYAGWSIVIIYTSAQTAGHQLYLYDNFIYADHDTNVDFDGDGQPGGDITGFLVPEQIPGEVNAAKLTAFIGEGDQCWVGESLLFNGTALSNALSPSNNVWNSRSPGLTADGVDIDTFDITWDSGLLLPRDNSAHIDLPTDIDIWNVVYVIIAFRSETTTGGALSYLIR